MPDLTAKPSVSIVVPFHNEEDNISELYARLHSVMEDLDWEYQFVFVDDGSTDLTYKRLTDLAQSTLVSRLSGYAEIVVRPRRWQLGLCSANVTT